MFSGLLTIPAGGFVWYRAGRAPTPPKTGIKDWMLSPGPLGSAGATLQARW
jgi:hypothetical protein